MMISDDTAADRAQTTLSLATNAQNAAAKQTRWFGWCMIFIGVVVIPGTLASSGPLLPFVVVVAVTLAVLVGVDIFMRKQRVVPRDSKDRFAFAVGIWFVLLVLTSVLVPTGNTVAAVAAGVVASSPFFVVGVRALIKRSRLAVPNS